jgi:DNA-binding beta-propeller fold protein YncE
MSTGGRLALLVCSLSIACAGRAPSADASDEPADAGTRDAGDVDGGTADDDDAGFVDDAGTPDGDGGVADVDAGLPPVPVFQGSWGGFGTEPGQFVEPSSVELDVDGQVVLVAGHENRVQRFTPDGELIDIFGVAGGGDGEFNHPHGLAVDHARDDLIYVGDQENHRLQVFTRDGVFVRQWGDAQFSHIHDIGIDRVTGDVFVGDYEIDIVRKFSSSGELLLELGGSGSEPGQFSGVWGISTDSARNVYVADTFNQRVQKLDVSGAFLAQWLGFGEEAFNKPTGVFVDGNDVVYVCDSLAQVIFLFDVDGAPLQRWDLAEIYGEQSEPEDIVIDASGRDVYVVEVLGHRVLHLVR